MWPESCQLHWVCKGWCIKRGLVHGCNNSVWSRLKTVCPFCVQLKCICHSLALCIQYAVSKLPSNNGFLLSEIPNWFHHSELRREAYKKLFYKKLFRVMNTATEFEPN